jgi:hypothetical protein
VSSKSDTAVWDGVFARVKAMRGYSLSVGVVEDKQHPDSDLTIAEIGAIAEYGNPAHDVEPRPWLGFTWNRRRRELAQRMREGAEKILAGKSTAVQVLSKIGEYATTQVKQSISQRLIRQELAASTLARRRAKGQGTAALRATDALYDAIGFKIDKG